MVRILTAIVFADIYGYTAMMQKDEPLALKIRSRFKQIIENNAENFEGKLIQFYGDGALLIFASGLQAAEFAIKLQNETAVGEPKVPVKTAIHIGDIVHDSEGVFGDGVNVTSRIESIAHPGSVLISDKLNDVISNQPHIKTKSLGKFNFKNIDKEIEVFAIVNEGLFNPDGAGSDGKMTPKTEAAKTNRVYYYGLAVVLIIALAYVTINYISKQNKKKEIITDTLKPLTKDETKELLSGYLAHLYQPAKPFTPTNVVLSENFSLKSSDDKLNPFSNDYKDTLKNKTHTLNFANITSDDLSGSNYSCNFILTGIGDSVSAKLNAQIKERTIKVQSIEYVKVISLRKEEPKKETLTPEHKKTDVLTPEEKFRIKQEVKQKLQKRQEKPRKRP